MPLQPDEAAAPQQLTDAQRAELRARLAHHQANPGERGVSMHELRAKLLGADKTPQPSP
ncbi:hypothetical protein LXT12_12565 [Pelomonas sp. P7]|uniref:Uncharacterized protein n=1 Tax=Pelomonas caseinilytica TaxID=2906763 RepID=A0ABS8XAW3_9BURK|nr:hypothetical protein [Pelomonas sp. P7]MCE4538084.1 hypothetical protein [Pelomonas sp. P7]